MEEGKQLAVPGLFFFIGGWIIRRVDFNICMEVSVSKCLEIEFPVYKISFFFT